MNGTYSRRNHLTCKGSEVENWWCSCCCNGCLYNCDMHDPDHGNCLKPSRVWWYKRGSYTWKWWHLFAIGGDEFCNPTLVLRLWNSCVINLSPRMRTETCDKCLDEMRPVLPALPE